MKEKIIGIIPQIWELEDARIVENKEIYDSNPFDPYDCPHVFIQNGKRYVPRTLIAINEGGGNSTGMCLDCILDKFKEEKQEMTDMNKNYIDSIIGRDIDVPDEDKHKQTIKELIG